MPPRYAYWTIIVEDKPTAFRSASVEEILPTFNRLKAKQPNAVLKWFQNGKLWDSERAAREAQIRRGEEGRRRDKNQQADRAPRQSTGKLDWKPKQARTSERPPKLDWSPRDSAARPRPQRREDRPPFKSDTNQRDSKPWGAKPRAAAYTIVRHSRAKRISAIRSLGTPNPETRAIARHTRAAQISGMHDQQVQSHGTRARGQSSNGRRGKLHQQDDRRTLPVSLTTAARTSMTSREMRSGGPAANTVTRGRSTKTRRRRSGRDSKRRSPSAGRHASHDRSPRSIQAATRPFSSGS